MTSISFTFSLPVELVPVLAEASIGALAVVLFAALEQASVLAPVWGAGAPACSHPTRMGVSWSFAVAAVARLFP